MAVALVVVLAVRPSDPTAGSNGSVGVTVSASGSPVLVLVLVLCLGSINDVASYGRGRGSIPDEQPAHFQTEHPTTTSFLFDLDEPPSGWTRSPGSTLSTADPAALTIAIGSDPPNELRQADFTCADLRSLTRGTGAVRVSGEHRGSHWPTSRRSPAPEKTGKSLSPGRLSATTVARVYFAQTCAVRVHLARQAASPSTDVEIGQRVQGGFDRIAELVVHGRRGAQTPPHSARHNQL